MPMLKVLTTLLVWSLPVFGGSATFISIQFPVQMKLPTPAPIRGKAPTYKVVEGKEQTSIEFHFRRVGGTPPKTDERVVIRSLPDLKTTADINSHFGKAFPGSPIFETVVSSSQESAFLRKPQQREIFSLKEATVHVFKLRGASSDVDNVYILFKNGKGSVVIESVNPLVFDWRRLDVHWK